MRLGVMTTKREMLPFLILFVISFHRFTVNAYKRLSPGLQECEYFFR